MKIIQHGEVFVKQHREKLPMKINVYDKDGLIGYLDQGYHKDSIIVFKTKEGFDSEKHGNDLI